MSAELCTISTAALFSGCRTNKNFEGVWNYSLSIGSALCVLCFPYSIRNIYFVLTLLLYFEHMKYQTFIL